MKLSTHFDLEDFVRSQTAARAGIDNTPPEVVVTNLQRLAETLERIRVAVGNRAITITSGYRCPTLNHRIGGSKTSAHMDGRAADIVVRGLTPLHVARLIHGSDVVLDQLIYEGGEWVHVGIARCGDRPRRDVLTAAFSDGLARYQQGIVASI